MRGIANTQLFGPAGVQLYVDGIPQADISSYSSTLYDIESIEFSRGPTRSQIRKICDWRCHKYQNQGSFRSTD